MAKREQVIAALGKPRRVLKQADGSEILDFSNQPYSHACYMVTVDAQGTVTRFEDALSDLSIEMIRPGMTRDEVARRMCEPVSRESLRYGETVWEWELSRPGGNNANMFSVYFRGDRVFRTERRTELSEAGAG